MILYSLTPHGTMPIAGLRLHMLESMSSASCLLRIILLAAALLTAFGIPAAAAQGQRGEAVAIVVNPSANVSELSFAQLRKIFLGEQQYWPDRERITLLVRAPEAYERDVVLRRIYEMNEAQFRQYWIAKIFRSEVTSGPKIVYSSEMTRELVAALPGSIAFMRANDASGDNVKVLRIDGKLPGDRGYPLQ